MSQLIFLKGNGAKIHTCFFQNTSAKKAFKTGQKRHRKTGPATGLVPADIKSLHLRPDYDRS